MLALAGRPSRARPITAYPVEMPAAGRNVGWAASSRSASKKMVHQGHLLPRRHFIACKAFLMCRGDRRHRYELLLAGDAVLLQVSREALHLTRISALGKQTPMAGRPFWHPQVSWFGLVGRGAPTAPEVRNVYSRVSGLDPKPQRSGTLGAGHDPPDCPCRLRPPGSWAGSFT